MCAREGDTSTAQGVCGSLCRGRVSVCPRAHTGVCLCASMAAHPVRLCAGLRVGPCGPALLPYLHAGPEAPLSHVKPGAGVAAAGPVPSASRRPLSLPPPLGCAAVAERP